MEIRGKVAVVTGAGSGIGQATAIQLAQHGAAIVVADIQRAGADETMARIADARGRASSIVVDVAKADDIERLLAHAEDQFGGIDILFNNAGVTTTGGYPAAELAVWQRVVDINLRAVILGTQLVLPRLRKRGGGTVVHSASMAAFVGFPPDPVYAATKAAVVLFTHSLGYLAGEGIRVNCVCPGLVDTPLLRQSTGGERPAWLDGARMLQPNDIADAVLSMITDDTIAGRALQVMPGSRTYADIPGIGMGPTA